MNPIEEYARQLTRRQLLSRTRGASGPPRSQVCSETTLRDRTNGRVAQTRARRTASSSTDGQESHLSFHGGRSSHIDMFDYKPELREIHGTELPDSIRNGLRLTGMSSDRIVSVCCTDVRIQTLG